LVILTIIMKNLDKQNDIIQNILKSYESIGGINHLDGENLPSRNRVDSILKLLIEILFPGYFEHQMLDKHSLPFVTSRKVATVLESMTEEILKSLCWSKSYKKQDIKDDQCLSIGLTVAQDLLDYIPLLRKELKDDISAIFDGDPAAKNEPEIILAYPGFKSITVYRIAHFLYKRDIPMIPRLMSEIVHSETGIDIHPGATIGRRFCIDHGTGVVIGETAVIGKNVKLYQGVTIGALSVSKNQCDKKRHPTIENNVTIYARTTILGGETVIGEGSVIGGNVWLTASVPSHSKVYVKPSFEQFVKPPSS
jgi:serine O-acetyltransferase